MIDNLEELLVIEKRIDERGTEDIRDRWESGKVLIKERAKPKGRGRPGIPKARMDELVTAIGKGERELKYRMQFAEQYKTDEDFGTAMHKFANWQQVKDSLPQPKSKPVVAKGKTSAPKPHPKRDEIIAVASRGKTKKEVAEETGVPEDTVRRELERDAIEREAAPIDFATLPGGQMAKLTNARERIRKELEREFQTKLLTEVDQLKAEAAAAVAEYKAKLDAEAEAGRISRNAERERYRIGVEAHRAKGLISLRDYRLLYRCLHTDTHKSVSNDELEAAFIIINDPKVKALLVKEG